MKLIIKRVAIWLGIVLIDLAVYAALGIMMMAYDDFYDESKGEYWSWASMTNFDRAVIVGLYFWHLVNFVAASIIIYNAVKSLNGKHKPNHPINPSP
ncbi:hypothetical protein [Pontibacter sp. H249]|uniref:hypothetical protein n=1 Tax=Pontibacter sp. H249 TaxID=3133420 RepID=UPI0030C45DB4